MKPEVERSLTVTQARVAREVLAEEESRRRHLLVSLSGAHAYGFPSPDSDLDLKAVHVDPTERLLGFPATSTTAERLEVLDGVEVDYSSNELGHVLRGVLKGNGNYVERFLSGYLVSSTPEAEELVALVQSSLSRRLHRHYQGFAIQQHQEWERGGRASAKKLLYVLRTGLTGVHVLREREIVTDVTRLLGRYGLGDAAVLVDQKRRGERTELPAAMRVAWGTRVGEVFALLDRAAVESLLPAESPNASQLEAWLVDARLRWLRPR
jgi:uncharacterized protein